MHHLVPSTLLNIEWEGYRAIKLRNISITHYMYAPEMHVLCQYVQIKE
jgi:hypothetical protein